MLRFGCCRTVRLGCLWFLTGLSPSLHTESSPTRCAIKPWHRMSPHDQMHTGLCWTEVLTLPEVTYIMEWNWFPPLVAVAWKLAYEGAIGKDRACGASSCDEPVGLTELEDGAMEMGEEAQHGPGDPSSSLQRSRYGFALLVFMGLGSSWEPHGQFEFGGGESPATMSWLKWALA